MLLAQISDLHIRSLGEKLYDFIDTNLLCARHVATINQLEEQPDAIIITGDICNCGYPGEYRMARRILDQLDYPVFLLPGNHDDNVFFLQAFSDHYRGIGNDPDAIVYSVDDFPIRLLLIDSSVHGELYGTFGEKRLALLDQLLSEQPDKETILFTHHHPLLCGCMHMDTIHCRDGENLFELLKNHPQVTRIFCGHTHRATVVLHKGILVATCPSTCHQVPYNSFDPNGFYSLEPPAMYLHRYQQGTGLVTATASLAPFDGPWPFNEVLGCPKQTPAGE